jgi:hypothetical protein
MAETHTPGYDIETEILNPMPEYVDYEYKPRTCATCLVDPGRICRHLTPRKGEGGLGHQGMRPLMYPHKDRKRL